MLCRRSGTWSTSLVWLFLLYCMSKWEELSKNPGGLCKNRGVGGQKQGGAKKVTFWPITAALEGPDPFLAPPYPYGPLTFRVFWQNSSAFGGTTFRTPQTPNKGFWPPPGDPPKIAPPICIYTLIPPDRHIAPKNVSGFYSSKFGRMPHYFGGKKNTDFDAGGSGRGSIRGGLVWRGGVGSKMVPSGPYFWGSFFGVFGPITPTCRHPKSDFYDFSILFSYFLLIKSIIFYEIFMKMY